MSQRNTFGENSPVLSADVSEHRDRQIQQPGAGRPRDPEVDRSILEATRELLTESGYQKTTISAISRRARVGTAAIYRRWATRESIVEDAIFGMQDVELPTATGDLRADLLAWTRMFLDRIAEPATRSAIPGLLSAYHHHEGVYERLVGRSELPAREAMTRLLASAAPERTAETTQATANAVFDLLMSATTVRGLTVGLIDAESFCARTADALTVLAESGV